MEPSYAPPRSAGTGEPGPPASSGSRKLDLLLRLAQERGGGPERIRPRGDDGPAPLSFGQERLWLVHQLDPGVAAYHVTSAFRFPRLDVEALERALGGIVRRHQTLRTTLREIDGVAAQVVAPFEGFTLPVEDLSAVDEAERDAVVSRRAAEERARPYDLSAGPLFRPRLLRLGDEDVLLLNLHHVVSDAWSMEVLQRELAVLYAAYVSGREAELPALEVQYADFAVWQRQRLSGDALERQLAYWRERLAGAPALLELPTDRPRPAVQSFRGAREAFALPVALVERLKGMARGEEATLFMVLLAAFQVLLARYGGNDDVVVGTPVAGRGRRELEGLVGFFGNTLALRADLSGDPGFREVLRRVRGVTLGAFEHQEMPFEKLVAELQPERSLSHSPLFQVMLSLETATRAEGAAGSGLPGRQVKVETGTAQFDLTLGLNEGGGGLHGALVYSTDLFEAETARRMLRHLRRVLEQVVEAPDAPLSRLELADADERRMVVETWNRTDRPFPRDACLHELFESHVRARPDAEALAWGDESLTYRELDARANRLANHLVKLGVGPDARVGVLLERSAELVVSILAIVKAGGCYVPLDPTYPAERLALMVADAGVRVVVSRSDFAGALGEVDVQLVALDAAADVLAAESPEPVRSGVTPDNLAYIVYTSGSTGRPKGVMVAHRHVVQLVVETDYVRLGPGDRIAQASNASFDALAFEAWGAFLNGATLVGIPRDVLLSPPALREMLREERITTLYQTTALLNQLTREQPDVFATLREVLFGGQAVDAESVRRLLKTGKPRRLLHMYGPTETTAWCSFEKVDHVDEDALTVTVGRPTGNARIYILDPALNPTPLGIPGEAYVGGAGIVRGYLDRPALTAERFVPDPFAAEPGARMYRTGDRLRWKTDGTLEFIGRLDAQVKIRGFRIEPGEIESALSTHPAVAEARVVVREDEPGEKRLVAYIVGDAEGDADALRAHLRRTLPEYMVPAAFVSISHLPLTAVGKLDVKALPAPEMTSGEERYVAPATPAEEVLAGIWAEVLRLERVGARDNFFELGGHSLLATRVVSRVREVFSVELPLRAVFEGPTVAELAARVEELRREGVPVLPPVTPADRSGPLPLSFAQERLWFIDRLEPGSAAYNMPFPVRLRGVLDAGALEHALGELVARHEVLRTTIHTEGGRPVQVVHPPAPARLHVVDLEGLDREAREEELARLVTDEAARPFDLAAGPLLRTTLVRLAADEQAVLFTMHHVVSDGWSMGVLVRELSALYAARVAGRDAALPPLPVQYADYAAWQRGWLAGEVLERQLAYWRGRLAGAPPRLELPTDRPRPPRTGGPGARLGVAIAPETARGLRALARREGASVFMVLLAAWQALLARFAGEDDVVVGTPIAGRTQTAVEGLIGLFVNTLALRADLSEAPAFRDALRLAREATLGAYAHQDLPFEKLVEEMGVERSLSHTPLFQVMFAYQERDPAGASIGALRLEPLRARAEVARFDLSLQLAGDGEAIGGALAYRTALFDPSTIRRMLDGFRLLVDALAADPGARIGEVPLLPEAERHQVLAEWNRTGADFPGGRCVHELFREQAMRTPEAVAVSDGVRRLTYAELEGHANRLAHHLRGLGVGPEARVGVCLERGVEGVAAILGVLKAGGAYLPLDPSHPAERLRTVLDDAGAGVLVAADAAAARLGAWEGAVVRQDADRAAVARESAEPPEVAVSPGNLAYLIYTSGSTGRPKGVMVEHRSVVNLHAALEKSVYARRGAPAPPRVSVNGPLTFDTSVKQWVQLLSGATLCVVPEAARYDAGALGAFLREEAVEVLDCTPVQLRHLLAGGILEKAGPALTDLLVAGEAVDAGLWAALAALEGRRAWNLYGPTECTVDAALAPVAGGLPVLGGPIANARAYVLDAAGAPVPVRVAGELYVGGAGVARGYAGRPGATAERFVPDPFSGEPGARLYRTGDRARWTGAGALEYLGRTDFQLKVRGFRVEPREVEAALESHPAVRRAVVVAREERPGEARLVAYAEGGAEASAGPAELLRHLRDRLPGHLVPSAVVVLDALPLTPHGKVDRRALPAPAPAREGPPLRPETELEARLAAVWREVLEVEEVGVEDNFFDLGGHSLLLVRLQARVAEALGRELPVVDFFQYPTVRALAGRLRGEGEGGAVEEGEERGGARAAALGRRLEARRRRDG